MGNNQSIPNWLQSFLNDQTLKGKYEAIIFGSYCSGKTNNSDVDLMLIFQKESIQHVIKLSTILQTKFKYTFGKKLHLLRLTWEESEECKNIIDGILSNHFISLNNNLKKSSS